MTCHIEKYRSRSKPITDGRGSRYQNDAIMLMRVKMQYRNAHNLDLDLSNSKLYIINVILD